MSKSVELADAIAALLNDPDQVAEALGHANGFSLPFEAIRRAGPFTAEELEELKNVQVAVYTGSKRRERVTRGRYQNTYKPFVAISKYMAGRSESDELKDIDALEQLDEEICTVLEDADLAGLAFQNFDGEDDRPAYNFDALGELKVFVTAIELEYSDA